GLSQVGFPAMNSHLHRPRVLVLFGGVSGEHSISCVTAGGVLRAIDRERYDVLAVGITRTGRWVEVSDDPDRWAIVDGVLPEVADIAGRVILRQAGDPAVARVIPEAPRETSTEATDDDGVAGAAVVPDVDSQAATAAAAPSVADPEGGPSEVLVGEL